MKTKRNLWKGFFMALIFCLLAACPVQAASSKSTAKWASAYMKIIRKLNKENSGYQYDLIYFNNDKIPELVVGQTGYWVSMYSYSSAKKKVYTVMDHWPYGAMGNAGYSYVPKKNVLYNCNSDFAGAIQYVYYGKMKNYKIVSRYKKELKIQYFRDKNKNGYPDSNEFTSKPTYYYGNKRITKKKFNSYKIKGTYKTIMGSMSYSAMRKQLISKGA